MSDLFRKFDSKEELLNYVSAQVHTSSTRAFHIHSTVYANFSRDPAMFRCTRKELDAFNAGDLFVATTACLIPV